MVCPAVVKDPHLGEGDVYYGAGGPTRCMVLMVPLG